MSGFDALYFFTLALAVGYLIASRVPSILHTPLLAGSTLIHGVVLAGTMIALANAQSSLQIVLGMLAVSCAAANATGAYLLCDRVLTVFERHGRSNGGDDPPARSVRGAHGKATGRVSARLSGPAAGRGAGRSGE